MAYKFTLDLETKGLEDQAVVTLREIDSLTPQRFIKEFEEGGYEISDLSVDLEEQYTNGNRTVNGIRTKVPLSKETDLTKIIGMSAILVKEGKKHAVKLTRKEKKQDYVSAGDTTRAVQYFPIEVEINGESGLTEEKVIKQLENCLQVYEMRVGKQRKNYSIDDR